MVELESKRAVMRPFQNRNEGPDEKVWPVLRFSLCHCFEAGLEVSFGWVGDGKLRAWKWPLLPSAQVQLPLLQPNTHLRC